MLLSIIVPVYNMASEDKLKFCLDSLLAQTISDFEIIAVDDASTDASPDLLREYAAKYPDRFKALFHEKNKKQGGAKNTGLEAACGEYVGFIDSDDWISPDFYEKLIGKARETGADLVGCDYNLVTEHTFAVGKIVQNNTMDQTGVLDEEKHRKLAMRPGSMVIKVYLRRVIEENHLRFPEGIFYEDNCAGTVWSFYFKHFEKVEEPLYYYYQHDTSTVHVITEEKCRNRMEAGRLLVEECKNRGYLEQYYPEIEYRFTEIFYHITLYSYMLGAKHKKCKFVGELREGIRSTFPSFLENPYYQNWPDAEEKEMVRLHMKNNAAFFFYYGLKVWVRRMRSQRV